ncbi:DUF481 domain-containing protein [Aliarcobacter faecis]|uniref:DUF481 domain-containing protein n=1 Tax=Aliarcobacter faecis TaxID=1564138 RepID=UPI0004BADFFE|nr:DUF481 domain-containing protein [Aliarcobacter faecis]QKF73042.1 DUF481 domain-containing protein [Aliarcobacter faecis]
MNKKILIFALLYSSLHAETKVENRAELSYVNSSGNTNTSSLNGSILTEVNFGDREVKAKANIFRSKDNNEKSANKYELDVDYNHMIGDRLYTYMGVYYINDEFSDYDSRLNIGPGLGYKFIYTDDELLDIQGGLDYAVDKFEDGSKDEYVAPRTELNYKYKIKENIEFKQMLSYLVSMEDSKKYFFTSETGVAVKMVENLSLGANYRLDYVNQTEKKKLDRKFLTSLIYDF